MSERGRGRYLVAVSIVLAGLAPYVVLTTAFSAQSDLVARDLATSATAVQVAAGLGNAAYAAGLVVAAQLGLRFRQRVLFFGYASVLVIGSVIAALGSDVVVLAVGRCLEGAAGGCIAISALPMLLTQFDADRLPLSAATVNVGLFGASAVGPVVGGLVAASGHWRGLFWAVAAIGVLAGLVAVLGFPSFDPADPDRPVDSTALVLVVVATSALFLATSFLTGHPWLSWWFLPLAVLGLAALVALVVVEDRQDDALVPVRSLSTQLPVTGLIAVMVGGASFVAALQLAQTYLSDVAKRAPDSAGWLFWPAVVGAAVAAAATAGFLRTRYLPILVDAGLVCLAAASGLLLGLPAGGDPDLLVPLAAALLGAGAGATVAPGLFLIGFGLPIDKLGRAFAMVQLLRSIATYAVAPVVAHVAMSASSPTDGTRNGLIVILVLALVGLLAALGLPLISGARLHAPDLEGWMAGDHPAMSSPDTASEVRSS